MGSLTTVQVVLQWHKQYRGWVRDFSEVIVTTLVCDSHFAAEGSHLRQHLEGRQFHSNEVVLLQRCD
jgi:hypothetical protein